MSAEESRAKPLLQLLVEGKFLALSPSSMETLATWVAVKFMVLDQKDPTESVITQDDRSALYANRELPAGLKVWLFRTNSAQFDATYYMHSMGLIFGPPSATVPKSKNIKSLTLGFGEMLVYAVYAQRASFYDHVRVDFTGGHIPIWPITQRGALWPPPRALTDEEALNISGTLRKVWLDPFVGWLGE